MTENQTTPAREDVLAINLAYVSVLRQLAQNHAPGGLILLQGGAYLSDLYPDLSLRPVSDIDLLVEQAHLTTLKTDLAGLGFSPDPQYANLYRKGILTLDLHTDLFGMNRIRARKYLIPGFTGWRPEDLLPSAIHPALLRFGDELQVILHAVHTMKHSYSREIWLRDARLLLARNNTQDFAQELKERANRIGCAPILDALFARLKSAFGQELDLSGFGTSPFNRLQTHALKQMAPGTGMDQAGEIFFLGSIRGPHRKLLYLFETAFPRAAVLREAMNRPSSPPPLLYLLRTKKLAEYALRFLFPLRRPD